MGKNKDLSVHLKDEIVTLNKKAKWTPAKIAKEENIPDATVRSVIKKFEKTGTVDRAKQSGRPRVFDGRDVRNLVRCVTQDRKVTYDGIKEKNNVEASTRTIRRYLADEGYHRRKAKKKTSLTQKTHYGTQRLSR